MSLASITAILGAVQRTGRSILWERLVRPKPTTLDKVPPSVDALTREWLTAALCSDVPGAEVDHFELGVKDNGTSARRTITVTYNAAGRRAGLPEHLLSKSTPTFLTRLATSMANLLAAEHAFYSDIRGKVDIEAPVARYAAWDPKTNRSLFIMDDVTKTRGAKVGTILTREVTREQAEDMVDLLARLHAKYWGDPELASSYPWLMDPVSWQRRIDRLMLMHRNAVVGFDRARAVMPEEIYARRDDFLQALRRCRQISADGPRTLIHTDVHAGNWYVTADGRMGLLDYQCMLHGLGTQDLTYALIGNLTIDNRRLWERDLVMLYGECLAKHGVTEVPEFDQLWLQYRQMVPHAMFMWLGTIGANKLQPQMQTREVCLVNLERSSRACADLDAFGSLGL